VTGTNSSRMSQRRIMSGEAILRQVGGGPCLLSVGLQLVLEAPHTDLE
jgi:hypothetical protein